MCGLVKVEAGVLEKGEDGSLKICGVPLRKGPLSRLMKTASRIGVLHRCLSMSQLVYLRLVVKLVDRVASRLLAKVLAPIILKLLEAIKGAPRLMMDVLGRVGYWMMVKGWEKAEEISRIALRWGNRAALKWAKEAGFARYLTIMNLSLWERQGSP